MNAMQDGKIARVEELTRIPADVQDALTRAIPLQLPDPLSSQI